MLSGLYLSQHRIENVKRTRSFHHEIVPLPKALNNAGYRSAAFSHNPLFSPSHHFDYFDEFYSPDKSFTAPSWARTVRETGSLPKLAQVAVSYLEKMERPRRLFHDMLTWVDHQEKPFFLMANLVNIHYPWSPPPNFLFQELGRNVRYLASSEMRVPRPWHFNAKRLQLTERQQRIWTQLYNASIRHVDQELGRFVRRMKKLKAWKNTIMVITADHGELLGEHNGIVGHTLSLNDRIMHVPLILRHPDRIESRVVETVVQTVDLYASVLAWAQAATADIPRAQLQCPPFSETMSQARSRFAFAEEDYTDSYDILGALGRVNPAFDAPAIYPERQVAVHDGAYKMIWKNRGASELYNLNDDPLEQMNLAGKEQFRSRLEQFKTALALWEKDKKLFPPQESAPDGADDPQMMAQLRSLGYVA